MQRSLCYSVAVVATLLASAAHAAPVVDQAHVITQSVGGLIIDEDISPAQTFTVGAGGLLSQIDVQVGRDLGDTGGLTLELWSVIAGGPSGAAPLFTAPIDAADITVGGPSASLPYVEVDVAAGGLTVSPGEQYAVAVSGTAALDGPNSFWNRGNPGYDAGETFFRFGSGSWTSLGSDYDFGFRTWVDSATGPGDALVFDVLADAEARLYDNGAAVVNHTGQSILVDQETSNGADSRGLFEFDLSSLPAGSRIESATFSFEPDSFTYAPDFNYPVVDVYGYEGDGQALAANARDLSVPLGSSGDITELDVVNVSLNPSAVEDLITGSGILGLTAHQAGPPDWLTIASSERAVSFPGSFEAPRLSIQYSAPPAPDLPAGDYNGDAYVNAIDYAVWRDALGTTDDSPDGDGDGVVDHDDYDVWVAAYGVGPDATVRNGDFEAGDLSEWDVVIDPNTDVSFGFPRVESFDVNGDGQATNAMRVRVGRFDTGSPGGVAGLKQELLLAAGDYEFSADIASQSLQDFGNTGPGNYSLILDGEVIDQVLLNGTTIEGFEVIRETLFATVTGVQAGYHTLQIDVSRGATNTREIYHFFDNVAFARVAPAQVIPEPGTLNMLVSLAAAASLPRTQRG